MDSNGRFWFGIWSIVAASVLILTLIGGCLAYKSSLLVSQQPTCYGKVLQQSWSSASDEILALEKCDGQ